MLIRFHKNPIKLLNFAIVRLALLGFGCLLLLSCTFKDQEKTIWIYTSLYKDTISQMEPLLKNEFPGYEIKFYQAGSEEVAGKVYAESLAGRIQADILISSDRFWYEDMAAEGRLLSYRPKGSDPVPDSFRHPEGFYTTASYPVMIIAYNSATIPDKEAPQSFKELADSKWKGQLSSGSPLASGTSFTTVAFLEKAYGWDYFKKLRENDFIAEGGNSGVVRRIQNKERPVGFVLLENILRLLKTDKRIKFVIPNDGAVIQTNVLAIVKKERKTDTVQKIADWIFSPAGQKIMTDSYMYSVLPNIKPPDGAPPFQDVQKMSKKWSPEFIKEVREKREFIKEEFSRIVF